MPEIKCPNGKIINPTTGRCVSRTGSIGRSILSGPIQQNKSKQVACPNGKIINPKSGKCVSYTGGLGDSIPKSTPRSKPQPINNQSYEDKYPHMNKLNYTPSYRPHQRAKNAPPTPTKYSPMDGKYTYEKIKLVPYVNKVTSIQPGNKGSFEYISYAAVNQPESINLRHTKYSLVATNDMGTLYEKNGDLKVTRTRVNPQHQSYYLNPEQYHMGQPYFLGFMQPTTRGVCYIHAALNALAFSPLAPQLKTFMNKLGIYGTYSSDLHIATVFNDHVYSILSAHTDDIYSGGSVHYQFVVLLRYMKLKDIDIVQSVVLLKNPEYASTIFDNNNYIVLVHPFKKNRASKFEQLMNIIKRNKFEILCGTMSVKTTSYSHSISCYTHNGIKCLVDPNYLVRVPYDWTVYDEPKLQHALKQMFMVDIEEISYLLRKT